MTICVPRLNDDAWGFNWLFRMWSQLQAVGDEATFDFTDCDFLGQHAVAFLGGAARQLQARGCAVRFLWQTIFWKVKINLAQNGFLYAFGNPERPRDGNSIPFREDPSQNAPGYAAYLEQMWLGKNWVRVSDGLRVEVVSRVSEAYSNVFEHAKSGVGVFSCGQHYPKKHLLKLTLVDFGVGIPSNVRLHHPHIPAEQFPAAKCVEWALQRGTSTQPGGRGLGLDLLASFVRVNGGRMEIFSHEGHALVTKDQTAFTARPVYFEGTLVNVSLRCDERFYHLKSEHPPGDLF